MSGGTAFPVLTNCRLHWRLACPPCGPMQTFDRGPCRWGRDSHSCFCRANVPEILARWGRLAWFGVTGNLRGEATQADKMLSTLERGSWFACRQRQGHCGRGTRRRQASLRWSLMPPGTRGSSRLSSWTRIPSTSTLLCRSRPWRTAAPTAARQRGRCSSSSNNMSRLLCSRPWMHLHLSSDTPCTAPFDVTTSLGWLGHRCEFVRAPGTTSASVSGLSACLPWMG